MKNNPEHREEHELDALLRQLLLEGTDPEFTQNFYDMNADFIFSQPAAAAPVAAREFSMVAQLERAFFPRNGRTALWALLLLLMGAGVITYFTTHSTRTSQAVAETKNAQTSQRLAGNNPSPAPANFPVLPTGNEPENEMTPATDSLPADTLHTSEPAVEKRWDVTRDHVPEQTSYTYESDEYVENVPGPVFSAKPTPDNYKPSTGTFYPDTFHSGNVMFWGKQGSFTSTFYTGAPFKNTDDLQYFNFGQYAYELQDEKLRDTRVEHNLFPWQMPWAVLEHADTSDATVETRSNGHNTYTGIALQRYSDESIRLTIQPFYFRRYEVTNEEYREFVNWVRAANGYAHKAISFTVSDTTYVTNPNDVQGVQITGDGKRYRVAMHSTPTEDYKEVFNYVFFNPENAAVKALGKKSLYILPDTVSWTSDFTFSSNEPMTNYYNWHPAYDDYPVVGVSWFQAMAFLDWKTHMHQAQLDAAHIPYEIEYTLPSDIQWELASIAFPLDKNRLGFRSHDECTPDWMTDLAVSYPGHDDQYQRTNYLKSLMTRNEYYRGDFIADGYFHTGPANLATTSASYASGMRYKRLDDQRISWMDGNVSEWMIESYAENWQPFFQKHLFTLDADKSESTQVAKAIEALYDKGNAANGRLVRGGNWYDERFGGKPNSGRNEAGIAMKRYLDPSEQHCTVGFRYVVHVRYKDEQKRLTQK